MAYKRSPLVCVNELLFRLYVLLQKHKVGKMQLVLQKIVVAILLFSVVESPLGVQAQPPRECDFKVDDISCSRTTSLLLQLIISIVTIKTKASNPCWHSTQAFPPRNSPFGEQVSSIPLECMTIF